MTRFAALFTALALAMSAPAALAQQAEDPDAPAGSTVAQPTAQQNADFLAAYAKQKGVIPRPSGLMFRIIRNGFGPRPLTTDTVTVNYKGKLVNGYVFDGTSPGLPASFKVNGVIVGWTEALLSMRIGDRWELVIPASIGYGVRGKGDIGPNQTLIFDLELLATKAAPKRGEKGYVPEPGEPKS